MKNAIIILILGVVGLGGSSCEKLNRATQFDMIVESYITMQSDAGVNLPISVYSPNVETNSEAEFDAHDTNAKKVEEIRLTSVVLTIEYPNYQDFDFLREVEVFISAEGLSEVKLASKYNISNKVGNQLQLDVSLIDFQEYIKRDTFNLRVRSVKDEAVLNDVDIKIVSVFNVDAKVVGFAN